MLFIFVTVLAGIIISVAVVVGMVFGLPWLAARTHEHQDGLEGDPTERFSDSMRILRRDITEFSEDASTEVSTPLTRKAERTELRLLSRAAAVRRRRVLLVIGAICLAFLITILFGALPPLTLLIPVGLLGLFVVAARVEISAMRRRFDARSARVREGWGDEEDTVAIALPQEEPSGEYSVDLTPPEASGKLWDPIPVTAPTYVSKPLVPRTVRTIDLSAPVVPDERSRIPTADAPHEDSEELPDEQNAEIRQLQPRAVGE